MPSATTSPSHGPGAERRSWVRHTTADDVHATLATAAKGPIGATIQDVATGGVRLLMAEKVDAGTPARFEVSRPSRNTHVAVDVVVVYIIERAPDRFLAGVAFTRPLTEDELKDLL